MSSSKSFEEELRGEPRVDEVLARLPGDVFDPAGWLGSSELFVERALELYQKVFGHNPVGHDAIGHRYWARGLPGWLRRAREGGPSRMT